MRTSKYQKLYVLRNKQTGKLIFYYWASFQKHKAIFSTLAKAFKAAEIAQPAKKRGRTAKKAISKPVKTRKKKNG